MIGVVSGDPTPDPAPDPTPAATPAPGMDLTAVRAALTDFASAASALATAIGDIVTQPGA